MPSIISVTVLFLTLGLCSARRPRISPQASAKASAQAIATIATNRSSTLSQPASSTISSLPLYSASSIPTASVNSALFTSSAAPTATPSLNTTSRVATTPDGFKPGAKWQIAIQDPIDPRGGIKPADATVVDVDLFLASKDPTLIPALHATGATVLCYFNAGAVQFTDCDWPDWNKDSGLVSGMTVANYGQERYVDITSETVIALHKTRIDLAHSIGCDGIDPDNIDTFDLTAAEAIGKQITQADMIAFLETMATYAHSKTTTLGHPLMIGQKNAASITDRIHTFMDFAVSENCVGSQNVGSNRGPTSEFCSTFQQYYVKNGKPVFDIEYPTSLAGSGATGCSAGTNSSDIQHFCLAANSANISRILKLDHHESGLNGCTQYCSEETSFVLPTYLSNATNSCHFGP